MRLGSQNEVAPPRGSSLSWEVAALLQAVSDHLASRFSSLVVKGELSGFSKAASGHCYFSLKDSQGEPGLLRCAMFRRAASAVDFSPADGQQVELRGRLAVYEPRGELQFVVEHMARVGTGALYEEFLRRKARLESEGLFDASRKRPVPMFPKAVGVITSKAAAALHDVVTALKRRAPHVSVVVYPSLVQGTEAPAALVSALQLAWNRAEVDTLLLVRGGGSMEDLWSFNDERVVRAVAQSPVPLICGVGHETDITLCDLAADLRAPTPTAAAEMVIAARADSVARWMGWREQLLARGGRVLDRAAQQLDRLAHRAGRPGAMLDVQEQRLQNLQQRSVRALGFKTRSEALRWAALSRSLTAAHPQHILQRGFAWLEDSQGGAVTSVQGLSPGQSIWAVLADGRARASVEEVAGRVAGRVAGSPESPLGAD